jgi:hypothetical protein
MREMQLTEFENRYTLFHIGKSVQECVFYGPTDDDISYEEIEVEETIQYELFDNQTNKTIVLNVRHSIVEAIEDTLNVRLV